MGFAQFYQDGGFFMHVITVIGAVATGALVRGVLERRIAKARGVALPGPSHMVSRLALVAVLVGMLATIDSLVQVCAALRTIAMSEWPLALLRCGELVGIPLSWSLVVASSLLFADAMLVPRRVIAGPPAA